ncbi:MAG: MBL fold metallo-hydrolase [Myxococcales bacterium]|nr:MBL fold metallo-hydrolase [Myxococcales bacterium]
MIYELLPGIQNMPLRTPTLPPATHTNAFIVGTGQAVLVEPASPYPEEIERVVEWVEENRRLGMEFLAILATHHHIDHIGGATLLKERLGLPLWAHVRTAERLQGVVDVERHLADGERIALEGPRAMALECVHTPGHAPGHLCFLDTTSGAMIVGDMVASVGTILIEPVDGDMELYLASLARMGTLGARMFLPAHGRPITDPQGILKHYIRHREAREASILTALEATGAPLNLGDLLPRVYGDVSETLWPLARLSLETHLIKLEREGRATRNEDAWHLTTATPT